MPPLSTASGGASHRHDLAHKVSPFTTTSHRHDLARPSSQTLRLAIEHGAAFADESGQVGAHVRGAALAAASDSLEHRHAASVLRHVVEVYVIRCPPPLYNTHLTPLLPPLVAHLTRRLEVRQQRRRSTHLSVSAGPSESIAP